jgi:arylsulfatase A-like enzyme
MRGIVTIKKVFSDGTEELVAHDENVITKGLAHSFVNIFSSDSLQDRSHLLAGYFQVGSGNLDPIVDGVTSGRRTNIYSLDEPFLEKDYGPSATEAVDIHNQIYNSKGNFSDTYNPMVWPGTFVNLGDSQVTKVGEDAVYYQLVLGENTANGKSVREFGLFSRNPNNNRVEQSVMIAYKTLDAPLIKSDLFSLVIDWQIKFVADTTERTSAGTGDDGGLGAGFNVVVIMADDLGIDTLGIYDSINPYQLSCPTNANANPFSPLDSADGCGIYPHTPTLSAMASGGITFFNARANTMCSPTRANIMTGKCAFSSPTFEWLDTQGNLRYKGLWGHGIASIFNVNQQKMRGGLKGLGALYNFKNADPNNPYVTATGGMINLEAALLGGKHEPGSLRRTWPSSWMNHAREGTEHADGGGTPANFTIISDMLRSEYAPSAYTTGMAGKWHLASWAGMPVYHEDSKTSYGNGWNHLHNIGRWDYLKGMYGNLDRVPIPGHAGDAGDYTNVLMWEQTQDNYSLSDFNMGYINYFQYSYSGFPSIGTEHPPVLTTVSDTGWTTYIETDAGVPYVQGDASSYATNKTFADATELFNGMQEPFFLYIPLNAPHTPYTYPPSSTVYDSNLNDNHVQKQVDDGRVPNTNAGASAVYITYNAMVENMDYCLSSFLSGIDSARKERTIFIFQGDNGQVRYPLSNMNDDVASGLMNTLSGLGPTYTKLLNANDFPDTSGGQGGPNNSAGRFKASVYDRGVLIPYIVSASFLSDVGLNNTSSMAFIDVVDTYNTIAEIANVDTESWPRKQPFHTDGISFLPLLRGEVDASTAPRQFSFFENVLPIGGTTGNIEASSGTFTGTVGDLMTVNTTNYPWASGTGEGWGLTNVPDKAGENVAPFVPYERRRGFLKRASKSRLGNQHVVSYNEGAAAAYGDLPEASAGMYKLVRNTSGASYDELYQLRDYNFDEVDPFELNNMLAPWSGEDKDIRAEMLDDIGVDVSSNLNYNWGLLRIYIHLKFSLNNYLSFRTYDMGEVNSMYTSSPWAAATRGVETPDNSDDLEPI